MITTLKMTPAADAAGARYQALVDAWGGIYTDALTARDFGTVAAIERAGEEAYGLARTYLEAERSFVTQAVTEIATDALSDASDDLGDTTVRSFTEATSELLFATESYLLREITIQIERDIAQLQQGLRQAALHVRLTAQAQGITLRAALLQHRLGSAEGPAFYFRDRRNAKWPSRLYVRATWRQALLSVFNEVTLAILAGAGISVAQIRHADGKAGVHGKLVALGPNTALPTYGEIRADYFHPNAEAILTVPETHRS